MSHTIHREYALIHTDKHIYVHNYLFAVGSFISSLISVTNPLWAGLEAGEWHSSVSSCFLSLTQPKSACVKNSSSAWSHIRQNISIVDIVDDYPISDIKVIKLMIKVKWQQCIKVFFFSLLGKRLYIITNITRITCRVILSRHINKKKI